MDRSTGSETETDEGRAERPEPVALRQLWRWAAPWLGLAVLAVAFVIGLLEASRAKDQPGYVAGFVCAGLALIGVMWWLRNYPGVADRPVSGPLTVERDEALLVLLPLLTLLAIIGLLLAARWSGLLHIVGYALFGASLLMIAANLKHYFDARE